MNDCVFYSVYIKCRREFYSFYSLLSNTKDQKLDFETKQTKRYKNISMKNLPDNVVVKLQDIAEREGFTEISLDIKPGSNHGDNFLGELYSVTVKGKKCVNGKLTEAELYLLCKTAPQNEFRRKHFRSADVFKREAYVYNRLMPFFVEFQTKKGLQEEDSFLSFPKCYAAIADEEKDEFLIIMRDMRPEGYAMWPKDKTVDFAHARLVVQELAKLHAISFVLKDQQPKLFEEFAQLHDISKLLFLTDNAMELFHKNLEKIKQFLTDDYKKEMIDDLRNNVKRYFERCLEENRFSVITHGDCWNNNILYHYENGVCIYLKKKQTNFTFISLSIILFLSLL